MDHAWAESPHVVKIETTIKSDDPSCCCSKTVSASDHDETCGVDGTYEVREPSPGDDV